jgi:tetratricopeptide (TPR) repeat protein
LRRTLAATLSMFLLSARVSAANEAPESDALEQAVLLRTKGDLPGAERALRPLATNERGACRANYELGVTLAWQGELEQALAVFTFCIKLSPKLAGAINGRARTLFWLGRTTEAEQSFRAQIQAAPDDWEAQLGLSQLLRAQGKREESAACLQRVLAADPNHAEARKALVDISHDPQTTLRFESGAAISSGNTAAAGFGNVRLQNRLSSRHMLYAGVSAEAPRKVIDLGLAPLSAPSARLVPELGYGVRPLAQPATLDLSLGYRADVRKNLTLHTLPFLLNWQATSALTLIATARPGYSTQVGLELFASLGAQLTWNPSGPLHGAWILLQLFRYQGQAGNVSTVPALRASIPIGSRVRAEANASFGVHQYGTTWSYGGGIGLAIAPRMQLMATMQRVTGLADLTSAALSNEVQF